MGDVVSLKDYANKAVRQWLHRFIASAFEEGAKTEAIVTYLESQGTPNALTHVERVRGLAKPSRLTSYELSDQGGRNAFRAFFGLPAIEQPNGVPKPIDFQLSESGDAEMFAELHAEELRYDHRRGRWLISDDLSGLWLPDRVEHVYNMALETMRERQRRGVNLDDHTERKKMLDWSLHGESRSRLGNLLALAEKKHPLSDDGEHWDEDPWLIGCTNGVVDTRTGEFRRGEPGDRVTMRVSVPFDAAATCPLWEATLQGIFATKEPQSTQLLDQIDRTESQRVVDYMQRALGYSITGDCREECCFFTWGEGRNGKGTIMNTVGQLLGDYTDDMPFSTLEKTVFKSQTIPNDIAKMAGKRFITCAEVNEFTLNEARLKALTGRDPMTARFLNQEFFTFRPVCKIWIATNNKPRIVGLDEGIWSRIHLIPFLNVFEGPNRNSKLKDQLILELPGILNWLIKGVQAWMIQGLNPPETVRVATETYRQESEPIGPFIEQRCVVKEGARVQAKVLWDAYQRWASETHQDDVLSDKAFFKCLKRRFAHESGRQTQYLGLGLVDLAHSGSGPEF